MEEVQLPGRGPQMLALLVKIRRVKAVRPTAQEEGIDKLSPSKPRLRDFNDTRLLQVLGKAPVKRPLF